jgi:hypothetical protein
MTQAVDAFPEHCVAPLKLKIFVVQLPLCFRETPEMEQASLAEGGKKGKRGNQPDHADHQPTPGVFFEKMDHGVKNIAYFTNFCVACPNLLEVNDEDPKNSCARGLGFPRPADSGGGCRP